MCFQSRYQWVTWRVTTYLPHSNTALPAVLFSTSSTGCIFLLTGQVFQPCRGRFKSFLFYSNCLPPSFIPSHRTLNRDPHSFTHTLNRHSPGFWSAQNDISSEDQLDFLHSALESSWLAKSFVVFSVEKEWKNLRLGLCKRRKECSYFHQEHPLEDEWANWLRRNIFKMSFQTDSPNNF